MTILTLEQVREKYEGARIGEGAVIYKGAVIKEDAVNYKKTIKSVREHFVDYHGLTPASFIYLGLSGLFFIALILLRLNEVPYNNYEKMTGFGTEYITFDACYVKNSEGRFIRKKLYKVNR